ncbi:Inversin [Dactylella cylindrospora]|nr:Inversin [Dactylella cylindrospora]
MHRLAERAFKEACPDHWMLWSLVCKGDVDAVRQKLESSGLSMAQMLSDPEDYTRSTLLHSAISSGHKEMADLLITMGALLSRSDITGWSIAHAVAKAGIEDVMDHLKSRVDLNVQDVHGSTPLHIATIEGNLSIIGILVSAGVNLNCQDEEGMTALDYAKESNPAIFNVLLAAGANSGLSQVARARPQDDVTEKIHVTDTPTPILSAVGRHLVESDKAIRKRQQYRYRTRG